MVEVTKLNRIIEIVSILITLFYYNYYIFYVFESLTTHIVQFVYIVHGRMANIQFGKAYHYYYQTMNDRCPLNTE